MRFISGLFYKLCNRTMPLICACWLVYAGINIMQGLTLNDSLSQPISLIFLAITTLFMLHRTLRDIESMAGQFCSLRRINPILTIFLRIIALITLVGLISIILV